MTFWLPAAHKMQSYNGVALVWGTVAYAHRFVRLRLCIRDALVFGLNAFNKSVEKEESFNLPRYDKMHKLGHRCQARWLCIDASAADTKSIATTGGWL